MRWFLACLSAVAFATAALAASRSGPQASVVRLVNYSQRSDWASPWNPARTEEATGSGFVVAGGLVMTNAHVVRDSRLLLLHVQDDPTPHEAEVVHVAHDSDLALVRPLDAGALRGVSPLSFGGLPGLGSTVETLGYPAGGVRLSSTRGVVSRIEEQVYVHSGVDWHLAVHTDAAINPGSSGGPVVQKGRVVGVAFQADTGLENVGMFIPTEVISRFLRDVEDGRYDGYPELGVDTASLQHPAARAYSGLAEGETGVVVHRVIRGTSADDKILVGDVLLSVNSRSVANDGSVADGTERIPFGLLVDRMFIGETVRLRVLRDGMRLDVDVPLTHDAFSESRRRIYDRRPHYFVYGGLVFVPLGVETLRIHGQDWRRDAPKELLDEYFYRFVVRPELQRRERVVLLRRLDHPVNMEMSWFVDQIVERVNGRDITSLASLVETLENHDGDHQLLEFAHARRFGVLDRRAAEAAGEQILATYGIDADRFP